LAGLCYQQVPFSIIPPSGESRSGFTLGGVNNGPYHNNAAALFTALAMATEGVE